MPRIGLVLGGGGITGTAFHAGVLTALAQQGWDARDAEVIVGTSAGSTSAALLRAGFPPAEYLNRVSGRPVSAEAARVLDRIGVDPATTATSPRTIATCLPSAASRCCGQSSEVPPGGGARGSSADRHHLGR
ncbi:MAG: patatin-like phospholipase family protein [Candidatus Nanopelagicales bacterium]